MTQPVYIISSCSISAQHTWDVENFLNPVVTSDNGQLYMTGAEYAKYISPVAIRRMSRMLKAGITAGMKCLADAGVATPDAIILSTARGSVTDMEVFLKDMITLQEQALNPTGFIQSTYNSVNGWIAMQTKCTGYNQTYVHRGFSLELALFDTQLLFAESTAPRYVLAGGFDELTSEYFIIRSKIDYYKKHPQNSLSLFEDYDTPGSIAGEGAHFFTLSNEPGNAACAITGIQMLHKPGDTQLQDAIAAMLAANGLTTADIDLLVSGLNGDSNNRFLADAMLDAFPATTTVAAFKHLSGEYDTASGFGLWLADYLFCKQSVPKEIIYRQGTTGKIKNVLLCNITIGGNASVILLQGVISFKHQNSTCANRSHT